MMMSPGSCQNYENKSRKIPSVYILVSETCSSRDQFKIRVTHITGLSFIS